MSRLLAYLGFVRIGAHLNGTAVHHGYCFRLAHDVQELLLGNAFSLLVKLLGEAQLVDHVHEIVPHLRVQGKRVQDPTLADTFVIPRPLALTCCNRLWTSTIAFFSPVCVNLSLSLQRDG